ncbi:MAG: SDR family NAD(P)-dependent oxidoreductase, partial [Solirubrobacteraceae bacterium]
MKLEGRVAIVTGAAQGIGRAVADKLHAEGASVAVVDLNGDGARAVASGLDGIAIAADVSSETDCERMAAETLERWGRIDVLVNAAAIVPFIGWDEVDFAYWRKLLSVNLDGAYLVSRAVERPMREAGYGRIVHIASNAFMAGTPNMGPYLAAKGGVIGLTRALATELGRHGITANAVAPGITRTEGALATPHRDSFDFVQALQAIPRHGVPEDIAPAVAFL